MSYIRPDVVARVPISGGELHLSPGYDVLHHFSPLGYMILKYWDTDGNRMHNVLLEEEQGVLLANMVGLCVVERPFIMKTEHDSLVDWAADKLMDGDFGF